MKKKKKIHDRDTFREMTAEVLRTCGIQTHYFFVLAENNEGKKNRKNREAIY